jgi:invasion protein IalB
MLKPTALVLMIALATPAAAQITFQEATTPAASQAKPNKSGDKIVCERQDEIGSRLGGKKVCKTAAEWELERQQQRGDVEKEQQMVTGTGKSGG